MKLKIWAKKILRKAVEEMKRKTMKEDQLGKHINRKMKALKLITKLDIHINTDLELVH